MQGKKQKRALKITVTLSLLVAVSIICGKYLAISGGEILRFSFENTPIIMAGMLFGPTAGVLVGVVADLVGCVLVGYTINPLVTLGAAAVGLLSGLSWLVLRKKGSFSYLFSVAATVGVSHIVGSVLIKTFGLAVFYSMPMWALMLWRLLNYVIVGSVEGTLLYFLMKNKLLMKQFSHQFETENAGSEKRDRS